MSEDESLLRSTYLFDGLEDEDLTAFEKAAYEITVASGDQMPETGEDGSGFCLCIIKSGVVGVEKERSSESGPDEAPVGRSKLQPGDVFGVRSIFGHPPENRAVSAVSKQGVVLLQINGDDFKKALREQPETGLQVLMNIIGRFSSRLKRVNSTLKALMNTLEKNNRKIPG